EDRQKKKSRDLFIAGRSQEARTRGTVLQAGLNVRRQEPTITGSVVPFALQILARWPQRSAIARSIGKMRVENRSIRAASQASSWVLREGLGREEMPLRIWPRVSTLK